MFSRRKSRGFTLIELMIVISIILILAAVAAPIYSKSIQHAREAVLRQDMFSMRSVIDQYSLDKGKAPQSLQDLVTAGYLKELPKDPITNSTDTWQVDQEDVLESVDQDAPGISNVHSGAPGSDESGTPYSQY
ncbi:MAG: type II secretion system protein [Terriglobales bacterium]